MPEFETNWIKVCLSQKQVQVVVWTMDLYTLYEKMLWHALHFDCLYTISSLDVFGSPASHFSAVIPKYHIY